MDLSFRPLPPLFGHSNFPLSCFSASVPQTSRRRGDGPEADPVRVGRRHRRQDGRPPQDGRRKDARRHERGTAEAAHEAGRVSGPVAAALPDAAAADSGSGAAGPGPTSPSRGAESAGPGGHPARLPAFGAAAASRRGRPVSSPARLGQPGRRRAPGRRLSRARVRGGARWKRALSGRHQNIFSTSRKALRVLSSSPTSFFDAVRLFAFRTPRSRPVRNPASKSSSAKMAPRR